MSVPFRFCPGCGEDVTILTGGAPAGGSAPAAAAAGKREVIRREVTTAEKDRLWGLLPMAARLIPIGVLVEGTDTPIALVLEDEEKRLWLGANGEVKMLGDLAVPSMPAPPVEGTSQPASVPSHLCNSHSSAARAQRGQDRYGSKP